MKCKDKKYDDTEKLNKFHEHMKKYMVFKNIEYTKSDCGYIYKHAHAKCRLCGDIISVHDYRRKDHNPDNVMLGQLEKKYQHHCISKHRLQYENDKSDMMKPWEDPESLFCDTKFLNEEMQVKTRNGDECKEIIM